jgi:hypothetical protein
MFVYRASKETERRHPMRTYSPIFSKQWQKDVIELNRRVEKLKR